MTSLVQISARCPVLKFRTSHVRCLATAVREGLTERRAADNLPQQPARTRFAPSPTGYLHLGSLRTAVFNFLVAKATGGQFLLRVEDTDQRRTIPDAYKRLYEDLRWAGLQWDEGPEVGGPCGPYIQSERGFIYTQHLETLLKTGKVYRCFCSAERLQELGKHKALVGAAGSYDRKCTHINPEESSDRAHRGQPHVVRLQMPEVPPEFIDMTYGDSGDKAARKARQKKLAATEAGSDDPVIIKSDGVPTYHFANVVDDHHMKITHVIRAAEWLASTPKHIALYQAFGWQPPVFAHVGLLLDSDKQKLSKRTGSLDIRSLRENGILPGALVNHLALLGWSHRFTDDFLPMEDLMQYFDMKFTKGNVIVNDSKLSYLQGRHMSSQIEQSPDFRDAQIERITAVVQQPFDGLQPLRSPEETSKIVQELLQSEADQSIDLEALLDENFDLFYRRKCTEPEELIRPHICDVMQLAQNGFNHADDWEIDSLKSRLDSAKSLAEETLRRPGEISDRQLGKIFWSTLRWALFHDRHGLSVPEVASYLGRQETMERLQIAFNIGKEYRSGAGGSAKTV